MPVRKEQDVQSSRRPREVLKNFQTVSKVSHIRLEDEYLCLKEESRLLKQHVHILEQKLHRYSTELTKLRNGHTSSADGQNVDPKDTTNELKDHVVTLEKQREALQRQLGIARQQILALSRQAPQRPHMGQGVKTGQTDPILYALNSMDDHRSQKSLLIDPKAGRLTDLELALQSLKEPLKLKGKEQETPMKEAHKLQVDKLRLTITYNVDIIRLQKQLSKEKTAVLVIKEKLDVLTREYEAQLEKGQKSLKENQEMLLERVDQLSEQLKQEKQKALILESSLNMATISSHSLAELQERVTYIEEERNALKKSYNALLLSTLSDHRRHDEHESKKESTRQAVESWRAEMVVLENKLKEEKSEREKLEQENRTVVQVYESSLMEIAQERAVTSTLKEKHDLLQQEVLQYRQNVATLQEKLNRASKDFHLDVEELSEILLQIKAFRLQQESCKGLNFLVSNNKNQDLADQQASHAETILELQKTRELLVIQHRLNSDLQTEINMEKERAEREKEMRMKEVIEKNKLLKNRMQMNKLKDQLRDVTRNYEHCNQIIPHQYRRTEVDQKLIQMMEENTKLNQLLDGGSMLEINLKGATFTPVGLRRMRQAEGVQTSGPHEVVTFCTFTFLDLQMQSTPLVSGTEPEYSFTSRLVLTDHNIIKLEGQGMSAHAEVHQALGGVRFRTLGKATVPLIQALQHKGEKVDGRVNITGSNGEIIGFLEFWLHLFSDFKKKDNHRDKMTEMIMKSRTDPLPIDRSLSWSQIQPRPEPSNQKPAISQHQVPEPSPPLGDPRAQWVQVPSYNQTCHRRSLNHSVNVLNSNHNSTSNKNMSSRHNLKKDNERGESHFIRSREHKFLVRDTGLGQTSRPLDQLDGKVLESMESLTTNDSDVIIPPPEKAVKEGCRLKIEILSLLFDPLSSVTSDESVQQVYVEYRLLGVPRETTETPVSLRKPTNGEEIHFNFCRVIYVDYMKAATLRQCLYTKLERTDAKQGRLKFTVISEPVDEDNECADVGHAYLDLQELLLTGNDAIECQVDIFRMDDDQEAVGRLRVSLEAAQDLTTFSG